MKKTFFYYPWIIAGLLFLLVLCPVCAQVAHAQMQEMGDEELSLVSARSGITLAISGSAMRYEADSIWIGDTDHFPDNLIRLNDVVVDDGAGGYFSFSTPEEYPITMDVGTSAAGDTLVMMYLTDHTYPRTIRVGGIEFCGQDIGSLAIEGMTVTDNQVNIGAHGGIDLEESMRLNIDAIRYAYSLTEELGLLGIHLGGSFSGAAEDPTSWVSSGSFRFGDIAGDNPVTFDVGTTSVGDKTAIILDVPMQGSLRVEGVSFGGTDFGPIAIDGIRVHHFTTVISPGT